MLYPLSYEGGTCGIPCGKPAGPCRCPCGRWPDKSMGRDFRSIWCAGGGSRARSGTRSAFGACVIEGAWARCEWGVSGSHWRW